MIPQTSQHREPPWSSPASQDLTSACATPTLRGETSEDSRWPGRPESHQACKILTAAQPAASSSNSVFRSLCKHRYLFWLSLPSPWTPPPRQKSVWCFSKTSMKFQNGLLFLHLRVKTSGVPWWLTMNIWATPIFIYKIYHFKSLGIYHMRNFKKSSAKLCI